MSYEYRKPSLEQRQKYDDEYWNGVSEKVDNFTHKCDW